MDLSLYHAQLRLLSRVLQRQDWCPHRLPPRRRLPRLRPGVDDPAEDANEDRRSTRDRNGAREEDDAQDRDGQLVECAHHGVRG